MPPRAIRALGHVALKVGKEHFAATVAFYINVLQFLPDAGDVSLEQLSDSSTALVGPADGGADDNDNDEDDDDDEDDDGEAAGGDKAKGDAAAAANKEGKAAEVAAVPGSGPQSKHTLSPARRRRGRWLYHQTAGTRRGRTGYGRAAAYSHVTLMLCLGWAGTVGGGRRAPLPGPAELCARRAGLHQRLCGGIRPVW
jgi:hypothetical protein